MAGKAVPGMNGVRVFPPAPRGFDAFTASKTDLARYGIPQRPDPAKQPELAELWEQRARRYTGFTHLEPEFVRADEPPTPAVAGLGLFPLEACGFELTTNPGAPFLKLIGTWTVPHLNHSPDGGLPNRFRTFFGLGFLDVHVEMTVDTAQNNTALIRIHERHPGHACRLIRVTRSAPPCAWRTARRALRATSWPTRRRPRPSTWPSIPGSRPPSRLMPGSAGARSADRPVRWLASAWCTSISSRRSPPTGTGRSPTAWRRRWSTPRARRWPARRSSPIRPSR